MAQAAIAEFVRQEGRPLTMREAANILGKPSITQHPNLGPLRTYRSPLGTFWVSPRGAVVYFAAPKPPQSSRPLTLETARAFAEQKRELHLPDTRGSRFVLKSSKPSGDTVTYTWEQKKLADEVAIFPNWVEITISLSGATLARLSTSDIFLVRRKPVKLDAAAAKAVIMKRFGKCAVDELELVELPAGEGTVTVWTAVVLRVENEELQRERVQLNADTGEFLPD